MVKIKYSKLLKYSFLIILYTTIFFLLSLNFPKYISADSEKENNESKTKTEYSLLETNIVAFDGSQSSDEDGTIVSYGWNFGDGGTGSGVTATHTYNEPGNYKVTLTVTDDDGTQDTCDKEVVIKKNKKPDSKIEYSLLEENIVAFDGSSSSDEDGTIVSYDWAFGDGRTGSGSSVMHIYN